MNMLNNLKQVAFSYEHGNVKLPRIKQLVSESPDPKKQMILSYLRTNCLAACPGIFYDEITPGNIIGSGNLFSDGIYLWDDCFTNYVNLYNIPVPREFREHILENYYHRMKRHSLFKTIDCVEISNNPYRGYQYDVIINRNGSISYRNNTVNKTGLKIEIDKENAYYIINPIMTELFCYDKEEHGQPIVDGYHWKISFYSKGSLIEEKEGWSGEDALRFQKILDIILFAERFIPYDLGSNYLKRNRVER